MKEVCELHIVANDKSHDDFNELLYKINIWCKGRALDGFASFHFRTSFQLGGVCVVCSKEVSESESPS